MILYFTNLKRIYIRKERLTTRLYHGVANPQWATVANMALSTPTILKSTTVVIPHTLNVIDEGTHTVTTKAQRLSDITRSLYWGLQLPRK